MTQEHLKPSDSDNVDIQKLDEREASILGWRKLSSHYIGWYASKRF